MIEEVEQNSHKRGVGRPPKEAQEQKKKGNPSWKPANVVDVLNKEDGYRYRLVNKEERNLQKKKQEGWEILSGMNSGKTSIESGYGRINDGKPLTSVLEGSDYVVARLPEEIGKQRDEYYNQRSQMMTKSLYRDTRKEIGKNTGGQTTIHGELTIEQGGKTTVIED